MTDTAPEGEIAPSAEAVVDNSDGVDQGHVDATPEPKIIDLEQFGDYLVPLKVDGQEELVPLSEAREHAMRQADYTRSKQELARLREEAEYGLNLARALEEDPSKTLAILQMLHQEADVQAAEDEMLDPQEKRLRQVEQFMQAQEQAALEARVQHQLDGYSAQHGLKPNEVLQHAIDLGLGPDQLDLAVRSLVFERSQTQAAVTEAEQAAAAQEAAVAQAKADATFIAGGSTTTPDSAQAQIPASNDPKEVAMAVFRRAGLIS